MRRRAPSSSESWRTCSCLPMTGTRSQTRLSRCQQSGPVWRSGRARTGRAGILADLGGSERKGRWRLAASCSVLNVLGGSKLDLSTVELASEHVELKVVSVLGGAEIILPPSLNAEFSELAILGGNDIDVGDERPDPGGPAVHLRLVPRSSPASRSAGLRSRALHGSSWPSRAWTCSTPDRYWPA